MFAIAISFVAAAVSCQATVDCRTDRNAMTAMRQRKATRASVACAAAAVQISLAACATTAKTKPTAISVPSVAIA